ncbi:MAG: alpha/beta hydrolase family protein [Pyrinomonadaceae bacterium]
MKPNKFTSVIALLILFISLSQTSHFSAQQTGKKLTDLKLASKLMGRDMSYRVVLPPDYNGSVDGPVNRAGSRYPVIYLLHGLTGSFANWTDKTKLTEYALNHRYIIVTPDGGNGWYTDSVSAPNDKYESYIIKEMIPEIDKTYRTIATRDGRVIAGLSMGGYGSIKFGMKYPEMFSVIGSFSGALGAASFTEKTAGAIGKNLDTIYGPEGSTGRADNDVFKLVRDLSPEKLKAVPYVFQSCGTEDFLIQNNREFLALLNEKKVPHEYREHPGVHDWVFWDDQVREFLDLVDRRLKK